MQEISVWKCCPSNSFWEAKINFYYVLHHLILQPPFYPVISFFFAPYFLEFEHLHHSSQTGTEEFEIDVSGAPTPLLQRHHLAERRPGRKTYLIRSNEICMGYKFVFGVQICICRGSLILGKKERVGFENRVLRRRNIKILVISYHEKLMGGICLHSMTWEYSSSWKLSLHFYLYFQSGLEFFN